MNTCPECHRFLGSAGHREGCSKSGLSHVASDPLLAAACSIMRRLVDKVNENNEYEAHECPNGEPCGVCKTVAEAEAFIAANA